MNNRLSFIKSEYKIDEQIEKESRYKIILEFIDHNATVNKKIYDITKNIREISRYSSVGNLSYRIQIAFIVDNPMPFSYNTVYMIFLIDNKEICTFNQMSIESDSNNRVSIQLKITSEYLEGVPIISDFIKNIMDKSNG
jgi:hypothetical protein